MAFCAPTEFYRALKEMLELPGECYEVTIHWAIDSPVTVEAKYYAPNSELNDEMITELRRYRLAEIGPSDS